MTDDDKQPSSAPRRTRMTREARRSLILSAASEMFQKHGYAAASIDAIALASGISGPAIYRYFSRKTEILVALLDAAAVDAIDAIESAADEEAVTIDLIADVLVDRALTCVIDHVELRVARIGDKQPAQHTALHALRDLHVEAVVDLAESLFFDDR